MLNAYINYPVPHITIHKPSCGSIRQQNKVDQRVVQLTLDNLSEELRRFRDGDYRFAPERRLNDMWLELDLNDEEMERSTICYIRKLLATRYSPFNRASVQDHC